MFYIKYTSEFFLFFYRNLLFLSHIFFIYISLYNLILLKLNQSHWQDKADMFSIRYIIIFTRSVLSTELCYIFFCQIVVGDCNILHLGDHRSIFRRLFLIFSNITIMLRLWENAYPQEKKVGEFISRAKQTESSISYHLKH